MGHHVNDPGKYMPEERLSYYKARDPVDRARATFIDLGGATQSDVEAIEAEIAAEYEEAVEFSKQSGEVSVEDFTKFVANY